MHNDNTNQRNRYWNLAGGCPSCGIRFKASDSHFDEDRPRCASCGVGIEPAIGKRSKRFFSIATCACLLTLILLAMAGYYFNYGNFYLICGTLIVSCCMLIVVFPHFALFLKRNKWKAITKGRMCTGCGYDLYGSEGDICPECGQQDIDAPD
ncbi:MAG: hypothetical protein AB8C95_09390 [Phycisphaeraceae bacterium]